MELLKDRVAIVTGGTGALGRAVNEHFLSHVFGVVRGTGETVTDVVNASVVRTDDFLPSLWLARQTPFNDQGDLSAFIQLWLLALLVTTSAHNCYGSKQGNVPT